MALNERRVARLEQHIKARVAEVLRREMSDPRLGFITITKVKLDRELMSCRVFWSTLGGDKERRGQERLLQHARKFIKHEVAEALHTRQVPDIVFAYDESIQGAMRVHETLRKLREEREGSSSPEGEPGGESDTQEEGQREDAADADAEDAEDEHGRATGPRC